MLETFPSKAYVGKRVGDSWYFYVQYMPDWARELATRALRHCPDCLEYNVVKITRVGAVSFLWYRNFLTAQFPELVRSVTVRDGKVSERVYDRSNPPIFHRKELLLPKWHSQRERAVRLTMRCEEAGLFNDTVLIGRKKHWQKRLKEAGIR